MELVITTGSDERFILLCSKLDDYLNDLVGGEKQRSQYVQHNTLEAIHDVVLVLDQNKAIGCGSFRHYADGIAEIKRVFVCEAFRGKKYGQLLINELEHIAKTQGYQKLILETGKPLKSAIHLYEKLGYQIIKNYGPYINMPDSICMAKTL